MLLATHPVSGKLELHLTWMADELKQYIAWAVKHKFGVIDVNVPKFLTGMSDPHGDEGDEKQRVTQATETLALYLWENYIEPNESSKIIFLGIGEAFKGILHILNTRNYESLDRIAGVIAFAAENALRPVSESFIVDFAKWYFRNSRIFVARDHPVWAPERVRKTSRKFGYLIESSVVGLNPMLVRHRREVEGFLLAKAGKTECEDDEPKDAEVGDTIQVAPMGTSG